MGSLKAFIAGMEYCTTSDGAVTTACCTGNTSLRANTTVCITADVAAFADCLREHHSADDVAHYCSKTPVSTAAKTPWSVKLMALIIGLLVFVSTSVAQQPSPSYALDLISGMGDRLGEADIAQVATLAKREVEQYELLNFALDKRDSSEAPESFDDWMEQWRHLIELGEQTGKYGGYLAADGFVWGKLGNSTERGLVKRDERYTRVNSVGERIKTGTRSTPYDFGKSRWSDCNEVGCANRGNGGLTGSSDLGCSLPTCWRFKHCSRTRGEVKVRIAGSFEGRNGFDAISDVVKAGLERAQVGVRVRVCTYCCADTPTTGGAWEDNNWEVPPDMLAATRATGNNALINTITVSTDTRWERYGACEALKNALGVAGTWGNWGYLTGTISALVRC